MQDFKDILIKLGYTQITETSQYYRMPALYRNGDNTGALNVSKRKGTWIDFVLNKKGTFEELIQLTLNLKTIDEAKDYLKNKYNFEPREIEEKISLSCPKIFSNDLLKELKPDYSYFKGRGISEQTQKEFRGGLMTEGKLKNRFTFPIFGPKGEIVGFNGRDVTGTKKSNKWKLLGSKKEFKYPLFLNHKIIKEQRKVVLTESIGDCLALWECGIKNSIVLFGTEISLAVLNLLIKFDIQKIIISLNNDENSNNVGNNAAQKCINKLSRYFDERKLSIKLPPSPFKDWNEVLLGNKSLINF